MPPRNRDTGRNRYPEPEWDENASAGEYQEVYEDPAAYPEEDLPDWSGQGEPSRPQGQSQSRARSQPTRESQPSSAPRRRSTAPLPELSRSLQPQDQTYAEARRTTPRPSQGRSAAQYDQPLEEEWVYEETWELEEAAYDEEYFEDADYAPAPRRRSRSASRTRGRPRPAPRTPSMPPAIAAALAAQDRSALYLIGVSALSIFFMGAMLAARIGDLPEVIPIHLDAAGTPDLWGTASTLWRIVLAAVMVTVINAIAAWFLAPRDPFIGRFLVGSSLLAHVLAWIALFLLLF